MKTVREEQIGKARLRILQSKDAYLGLVITNGKASTPISDPDPDRLWKRLIESRMKESPSYFGYDGARSRFLRIFEGGFQSPTYVSWERQYKLEAKTHLDTNVPLEHAPSATLADCREALRAFSKTNMLSVYEQARVGEILKGVDGPAFLRAAADFALGDLKTGLLMMENILRKYGQPSWPAATFLPFLWNPQDHMFLKPQVSCDFAERVGHPFAGEYSPRLEKAVYESFLNLVVVTEAELIDLAPRDRIDIQSFIWIVGKYTEADEAEVHRWAPAAN